jgi:hypothetical protein
VDNADKLRIAKSSSNDKSWESLGGTGSAVPTGTIASNTSFTSLGTFTMASTEAGLESQGSPLPVSLIGFVAVQQARGVEVRWSTASEKDNAAFEVQRSLDGLTFTTISQVKGQGQSTQKHSYNFIDAASFPSLISYYRLRQVDFNGTATYSSVVAVKGDHRNDVFPNPANHQLTFCLLNEGPITYRVLDPTGQTVMHGKPAHGVQTLDVSGLPVGLYYLELYSAQGRKTHKFVRQNE